MESKKGRGGAKRLTHTPLPRALSQKSPTCKKPLTFPPCKIIHKDET